MKRESYIQGLRLYPASFAGHHAQGAVAAAGMLSGTVSGIALAVVWTALYIAYQALTRIRKQDAAGLDVLDYSVGFAAAVIGYTAYGMLP